MKKDSTAYKVVLLGVLCAICGLALGGVNNLTAPIIAETQLQNELANLELIYPDAEFTQLEVTDDSGYIQGAYSAEGYGTVYKVHAVGYNSNGFTFLVAIDDEGTIDGFATLEQSETSGFGARCFEDDFINSLIGLDASEDTPLLSGATITSSAIRRGIAAAYACWSESH